jgi:hypothetical protein
MTEAPARQRQRLLHREQRCAGVEVEGGIEVLLGDLAQLFGLHPSRTRHQNVQPALLLQDGREQPVQVRADRDVAREGAHGVADQCFGLIQLALAAADDEDMGSFIDEPLRGRQPDTAAAAGDHGDLAIQS